MVSKRKVWANNGAVLNPTYNLVDPFGLIDDDEQSSFLYRFRNQREEYFPAELENLLSKQKLFLPSVSSLGDIHEARPDIAKNLAPLTEEQIKSIKISAFSAINQSREMSQSYVEALKVWGTSGLDLEFFELVAGKYFSDPLFSALSKANPAAISEVTRILRENVRVICFTTQTPGAFHWQHYGNGGKGICYEIEDRYAYTFYSLYTPKDVSYEAEKPKLDLTDLASIFILFVVHREWSLSDLSFRSVDDPFFTAARKFVFVKQATFSAEQEVRLVDFSGSKGSVGGYTVAPGLFLRRLIIGPDCGERDVRELKQVMAERGLDVPLAQSRRSEGYELVLEPIN